MKCLLRSGSHTIKGLIYVANVQCQNDCWNVYSDDGFLLATFADEVAARHYAERHNARKSKPDLDAVIPPDSSGAKTDEDRK